MDDGLCKKDEEASYEERRRMLLRNLKLSINTVITCGHAMRVTVADMLQDFGDLRKIAEGDQEALLLCEQLERAVGRDISQNRRVLGLLGLQIISNDGRQTEY